ncbi:TlpA disulfide reductase family protein [Pedobacter sp. GR22-6]|uniref:TlpA disulfide reductase family protein n=1 Tax=Pedobacter sp. GR22-6 TaxID=3127957 RepID=UPI00307F8344
MKHHILTFLLASTALTVIGQDRAFILKGSISGQKSGQLKIAYATGSDQYTQDSTLIKNGTFEFKGKLKEPVMVYLTGATKSRNMDDPNSASFFIEPGQMLLSLKAGDFRNLKLKGSKTQDEYFALERLKAPINLELKPISLAYEKANEAYMQARKDKKPEADLDALKEKASAIRDQFEPFSERQGKIDMEFIKTHPNSYLSAYLLRWKVSSLAVSEAKALYAQLSENIKQSSYGKAVQDEIKNLEGGSPGAKATMFAATDINGQPFNLSDYKGNKYVLLDFWASWCVPCRKGNPHLLSLYSKYKNKGLEIVGVSDDDSNEAAWKKAVEQDQIGVWKHVLRGLKRVGNDFDRSGDRSDAYGIHTLPTKILIDKNGMIVGRYGGGGENDEAMDKKLAEIFN